MSSSLPEVLQEKRNDSSKHLRKRDEEGQKPLTSSDPKGTKLDSGVKTRQWKLQKSQMERLGSIEPNKDLTSKCLSVDPPPVGKP